jgi:ATP-dependent DNA helicase HFM1/MER3
MTSVNNATDVSEVIPEQLRCLFPFNQFNAMQTILLGKLLETNENVVVAAPTGSGKTVVHELALARLILISPQQTFRCVYIAPSKALCQQRWTEWKIKLEPLQLQVLEVTGDVDWKEVIKTIDKAAIIVTTPEKWDALTRMWRESIFMLGLVDLLLLDEIHHLGEDRGAVLETVVVRLRMINAICNQEHIQQGANTTTNTDRPSMRNMRIVALSATLPNISDVGQWLSCKEDSIYYFGSQYRPVPLRVLCFGYASKTNQFLFERSLDRYLRDLIVTYNGNKQTIVFCSSKKGSESSATMLKQYNIIANTPILANDPMIKYSCAQLQDRVLAELISYGIAYHHAGLPPDDRMIIEQLFLQGI